MHVQAELIRLTPTPKKPALVTAFLKAQPKAHIETAAKGTSIVREDDFADHSMLLLDGWAAFSKMLPDGETQIVDVMLPGDFALIGAAHASVAACSVDALSDVRYINIRAVQANGPEPELATLRELMAAEIVKTQSRTSELLLRMGKGSSTNRIAYALLEFFVRLEAIDRVDGTRFEFPMTQHKIGEFTGMSNVHVCRTMRRFERDGLISYPQHGEICLDDLEALTEFAGIDLDTLRHVLLSD
ncbi:Crp/Fnr family transcriptional regulator [Marivita sp. S0852]|uniref:Crp/Fnr family transcriptional regulator n=1 Tax=Marivita sp. S0852 TaxID=3373893 RepID=UPI003981C0CF